MRGRASPALEVRRGYAAVVSSSLEARSSGSRKGKWNDRAHIRVAGLRCCPDGGEREDRSTPDCRRRSPCLPLRQDPQARPERRRRHVLSIPPTDRAGTWLNESSAPETRHLGRQRRRLADAFAERPGNQRDRTWRLCTANRWWPAFEKQRARRTGPMTDTANARDPHLSGDSRPRSTADHTEGVARPAMSRGSRGHRRASPRLSREHGAIEGSR